MKNSAGILMYRWFAGQLEVLLVHPGGPYFAKKDAGSWSVPKGEIGVGEHCLETAKREFTEETGCSAEGTYLPLSPIRQKNGKIVYAWAVEGTCDAGSIRSNLFRMEWPPGSGRQRTFPEVDKAAWFTIESAKQKILQAQIPLLVELQSALP